jgi:prepilin-type N-terminal cleavage/methylation domain-containing protein
MKKLQKGFTLIELMIVIAIIAILAAILIPNFLHARAESVTAACEGNEKQIATAEEEYAVDNGGAYASPLGTALTTPYLSVLITDPVHSGNTYTINITAGAYGSYLISDSGGHDTTTTTSLTETTGATCSGASCGSVVYAQNSGVHGKP